MRWPDWRCSGVSGAAAVILLCGRGQLGSGQMVSVAPTILQSVVLHPCASAAVCGTTAKDESVIASPRSSGAMSGRLANDGQSAMGSTAFRSDPAVSARVRSIFLLSIERRLNGAAADAIARNMRGNDPVDQWAAMVEDQGLRKGDLADALASYWVLNWAMANGRDSSGSAMQAVREQVRWAVANQTELKRLTDAEKQAMAEEAMLNFVYEVTGYLQARQAGNDAMLGRFASGAEMRFRKEMAVDLQSLQLTDRGLEAKR